MKWILFSAFSLTCLVAIVGCGCRPSAYSVHIVDPYTNPVMVEAVYDAADDWQEKTGGRVAVEMRSDGCGHYGVICVHEHAPWCQGDACKVPHTAGNTSDLSGFGADVDIDETLDFDAMQIICRHELGHAMGLKHVDDPKRIMFHEPRVREVTPADAAEWKALR